MRSAQHFEVRNRTDANHRVITVAMARPVGPKWPVRLRIAVIFGGATALWIAAWSAVHSIL